MSEGVILLQPIEKVGISLSASSLSFNTWPNIDDMIDIIFHCYLHLTPIYLSIFLSFYLSIFLSFYLSIFLSFYQSKYISIGQSTRHSILLYSDPDPSIYLSAYLSIYLHISLSINRFIGRYISPSIYIHMYIHGYTSLFLARMP